MFYLLFTVYLAAVCFFIIRIPFIKNSNLTTKTIFFLFLLKITAGLIYGFITQRFYPQGSDAWTLNDYGKVEYQLLISDPLEFFTTIFHSNYGEHYGSFFGSAGSYWNDLRTNILIKAVAILDIFSRGNFYINSLFFNCIGFFGHVAFYRIFINIYKNKKWVVLAGCFLLPSALYFSSGLDKDCIVFVALGIFCYCIYFSLKYKFNLQSVLGIIISLIALLIMRNYVVIVLLPCTIAWIFCSRYKIDILLTFLCTFLISVFSILILQGISPSLNPLKIITQKQQAFFDLPLAASQMATDTLLPNTKSFMISMPNAINHVLLRPYFWEFQSIFYKLVSLEYLFYIFLFLIMIMFYQKIKPADPFITFCIVLSGVLLLFIGYIVPNAGSLIRYKSMFLPLLITPIVCSINFAKIFKSKHIIK